LSSDIYVVKTSEERDNQFHFFGFYKQLLDIFLVRRNIRSSIRINPFKEEIEFPEIDDDKLKGIHRREKALYILFLCYGRDGIDFSVPKNEARLQKFEERMKKINTQYAEIYAEIGGEKTAPDISVREIRAPLIAHIRRSIERLTKLYNQQDYNISTEGKMHFAVHIEPDLIRVVTADSKDGVPLHEAEFYKRIFK
ncbi:MAG: hypothetical protein K2M10_01785, partial [Muribaculaceae bacterium]|nr:hypothetical protein [Muribaculaceae bacterium]